MAASLPPEQVATYTVIIDGILATADLNTITTKKIREGLAKAVDYDISSQKRLIKQLIIQRFDKRHHAEEEESKEVSQAASVAAEAVETEAKAVINGKAEHDKKPHSLESAKRKASDSVEPEAPSGPVTSSPKKRRKNEAVDMDAVLAAKLQAEENAKSRPTRAGAPKKQAPVKKKTKKKSRDKVNADDDSELEGSGVERTVNRKGGFHKELILSAPLSELFGGEVKLSRPQATKKLWAYIKSNDRQDPDDKRTIVCDDALRAVFKVDKVNMFTMTKLMNQNMYNDEE